MSKDTNVTVTVNTDSITQTNIDQTVVFSDDLGDLIPIDRPELFTSKVYKNQKITWTAVAENGTTPIFIENVKREKDIRIKVIYEQ